MDITAELDALRTELQGCSLVAFTDLNSQLVLCSSAASQPLQEELNALSASAQLALDGAFAEGAAPVWGGENAAEVAMLMTGDEIRMFFRSPGNSSEALICVCSASTDLDAAATEARAGLARILASL